MLWSCFKCSFFVNLTEVYIIWLSTCSNLVRLVPRVTSKNLTLSHKTFNNSTFDLWSAYTEVVISALTMLFSPRTRPPAFCIINLDSTNAKLSTIGITDQNYHKLPCTTSRRSGCFAVFSIDLTSIYRYFAHTGLVMNSRRKLVGSAI